MSYSGALTALRSVRQMTVTEVLQALRANKWKALGLAAATLLSTLLTYNLSIRAFRRLQGQPPSPVPMPFIGLAFYYATLMIGKTDENGETGDIFLAMHEMSKDLGDIIWSPTSPFQGKPMISITNSRLLRKLMTEHKEFATNHYVIPGNVLFTKNGAEGLGMVNGREWTERRKLFVSVFTKMLTTKFMNRVCRSAIVDVVFPEINEICIKQRQPLNIREQMDYVAFDTVFYANFSRHFAKDDELLCEFKAAIDLATELAGDSTNFWKQMQGLPLPDEVYATQKNLSRLTQQIMANRRKELKEQKGLDFTNPSAGAAKVRDEEKSANSKSVIDIIKSVEFDSYLDYLLKLVDEGAMSDDVAEVEVLGLFAAAGSNIKFALEWIVVLCAKFASLQKRIRNELFRVHGIDRKTLSSGAVVDFDMNMASKCALLRAFVYESLRWQPFARNGLIREIHSDLTVEWKGRRYVLPKGAVLVYQTEFMLRLSRNERRSEASSADGWLREDDEEITPFNVENWLDEKKQKQDVVHKFLPIMLKMCATLKKIFIEKESVLEQLDDKDLQRCYSQTNARDSKFTQMGQKFL